MGKYLPYSGDHSIQEAVVALHFRDSFSPETVREVQHHTQTDLADELPRSNEIHQLPEIALDQQAMNFLPQSSGQPRLAGFERSKLQANAKNARVLQFLDKRLTIKFFVYMCWSSTLDESMRLIKQVLSPISHATNPILAINLQYIDRYTYEGPKDEPSAEFLFRQDCSYLSPQCFTSKSLWHCNSGWFEHIDSGDRILHQLNVSSAIVDEVSTVTLDHNAVCHLRPPRQSPKSMLNPTGDSKGIPEILTLLHSRNGAILRDMLLQDILEQIGLSQ